MICPQMGTWVLEVGRMVIYVAFPVAMFHYFNQPQYYEKWVIKLKRELYPPESEESNQKFREAINKIRQQKELEELKKMAEKYQ